MRRRDLLLDCLARRAGASRIPADGRARPAFRSRTTPAPLGRSTLPETMGPGCAFLDYDGDGWQDILIVNSMDWPGHKQRRSTLKPYRNNRNGTFTDVTRAAGLDIEMYGLGVAVGDYNNDGWPDIFITCVGQSRLFQNTGKGTFVDVTAKAGLLGRDGFSISAMWVDYDRDGHLDLFVTNYVRWSAASDVFCSFDGKLKSYCTPEAYRGATCWLFRNKGDGTFEDVTARAGLLDTSSKSLGVALFDVAKTAETDTFAAHDTQPNKMYRKQRNGTFTEVAVRAGWRSARTGGRGGMGWMCGSENSGLATIVVTNFDNEMLGLYRGTKGGAFVDLAAKSGMGKVTRRSLGFGCFSTRPGRATDLLVAAGTLTNRFRARPEVVCAGAAPVLNEGVSATWRRRWARLCDAEGRAGRRLGILTTMAIWMY